MKKLTRILIILKNNLNNINIFQGAFKYKEVKLISLNLLISFSLKKKSLVIIFFFCVRQNKKSKNNRKKILVCGFLLNSNIFIKCLTFKSWKKCKYSALNSRDYSRMDYFLFPLHASRNNNSPAIGLFSRKNCLCLNKQHLNEVFI